MTYRGNLQHRAYWRQLPRHPVITQGKEEEEEFYMLESPSLDYAVPDASRLRFLEYPQSSGR